MKTSKKIAVIGATGKQGGSLIRAMLNHPESGFIPRAVVRDLNSDHAEVLKSQGVELVKGNLDDKQSIKVAFKGVYGAFCVTPYWEYVSPEREKMQAKVMAEAAHENGLKHVIWSTLEDTRQWIQQDDKRIPTLNGNYKVPHFDSKGESDRFFKELSVPTTFLRTTFYWENLIDFNMEPRKNEDGNWYFSLPIGDKTLSGISCKDIGKCALGVFREGEQFINKTIGIMGEKLTGKQMAEVMSRVLGKKVIFKVIPIEEYRRSEHPAAKDMANMFQFMQDYAIEYSTIRSVKLARDLNPEMLTFEEWLIDNKDHFRLEEPQPMV